MAHELDMTTGRVGMAYIGETPWHGLGHKLPAGADLETWRVAAGLNWRVLETPVLFQDPKNEIGTLSTVAGQKILFRDDTRDPLSIVSTGYTPVQPNEVLSFMEKMMEAQGLSLETAGSIRGGRRIWALARISDGVEIVPGDRVRPYYLCATSYDKSMATTVKRTKIRVVCNNTLTAAAGDFQCNGSEEPEVRISHDQKFDVDAVVEQMKQAEAEFAAFADRARAMADVTVSDKLVDAFLLNLYKVDRSQQDLVDKARKSKGYKRVAEMFQTGDNNPGHDIAGRTIWGLINSVTRYVDFERGATRETSLDSAWFGEGNALKNRAFAIGEELVAA
jgi:phage/plasmid-like protein (TIGR03299 family)